MRRFWGTKAQLGLPKPGYRGKRFQLQRCDEQPEFHVEHARHERPNEVAEPRGERREHAAHSAI